MGSRPIGRGVRTRGISRKPRELDKAAFVRRECGEGVSVDGREAVVPHQPLRSAAVPEELLARQEEEPPTVVPPVRLVSVGLAQDGHHLVAPLLEVLSPGDPLVWEAEWLLLDTEGKLDEAAQVAERLVQIRPTWKKMKERLAMSRAVRLKRFSRYS